MITNISLKPVNFKFNEYLSKGYELLKKDFGNMLLAYIFCIIMSMIPLCSFLAMGNFYKYCRKVHKGEPASPSEIFNFDDFAAYLILQLIIIAAVFAIYIPMLFSIPFQEQGGEPSSAFLMFFVPYAIVALIAIIVISLMGFYIPALISLKKVHDIKTAWKMSKVMTKNNLWSILAFCIVVGFISQLGIILCGIGILLTMPFRLTSYYFAYEDAVQQIEYDEIKEIGQKNE